MMDEITFAACYPTTENYEMTDEMTHAEAVSLLAEKQEEIERLQERVTRLEETTMTLRREIIRLAEYAEAA